MIWPGISARSAQKEPYWHQESSRRLLYLAASLVFRVDLLPCHRLPWASHEQVAPLLETSHAVGSQFALQEILHDLGIKKTGTFCLFSESFREGDLDADHVRSHPRTNNSSRNQPLAISIPPGPGRTRRSLLNAPPAASTRCPGPSRCPCACTAATAAPRSKRPTAAQKPGGFGILTGESPWIHREGVLWQEPSQSDRRTAAAQDEQL